MPFKITIFQICIGIFLMFKMFVLQELRLSLAGDLPKCSQGSWSPQQAFSLSPHTVRKLPKKVPLLISCSSHSFISCISSLLFHRQKSEPIFILNTNSTWLKKFFFLKLAIRFLEITYSTCPLPSVNRLGFFSILNPQ